jgi:hypothetical protein
MSSKTQLLAALSIAAFFMVACNSDNAYAPQSAETNRMMDSDPDAKKMEAPAVTENNGNEFQFTPPETEMEFFSKTDSMSKLLPSSAAALNRLDSTHLFIRTGDVRCRVDEVDDATYRVEDVVKGLGGYVSDTKLASTQTWQQQTQVSDDSIRQVQRFVVSNTLTIRVPARHLDSLLRALVPLVQYMDYRNINVNDITLDQLAKQLEQKRLATYNAMLKDKIIDETNKPDKIMNAAEAMLARQAQADAAFLESLRLNDRVAYATLTLQLYQPESAITTMIFHEKPMEPYDAGIGERLGNALYSGWKGFSYLLAGIVLLWPLWLVGGGVYIFVRWQMKKRAKAV